MKTAISIPDELFESADALAERLGVSRSHLYASAVAEYLAKHVEAKVTDRLNSVYAGQSSQVEPDVREAQRRTIERSEW
jgi:metal-responsive CopG/Arc/MetJ family transcriptional regulator